MESPDSGPSRTLPPCPTCGGAFESVYSRFGENVYVCIECHTGITVPRKAWGVATLKNARRIDKPDKRAR